MAVVCWFAACDVTLAIAPDAKIACAQDDHCPQGMRCSSVLSQCVPTKGADDTPPAIELSTQQLEPLHASSTTIVNVSFRSTEELFHTPVVVLGTPDRRPLTLVAQDGRDYRFSYAASGTEPTGAVPVLVTLTDLAGNIARDVALAQPVTFDFLPPEILSGGAQSAPNLKDGALLDIEFVVSEPLAQAPLVRLDEDTALAEDTTVVPPGYRYTLSLDQEQHTEGPHDVSVSLADLAGNSSTVAVFAVTSFDFTSPAVVGTPTFQRTVVGANQQAAVSITMSEPIAAGATLSMTSGGPAFDVPLIQTLGRSLSFALTVHAATHADGVYTLTLDAADDLAGNAAPPTNVGQVTVDTSEPQFVVAPAVTPSRVSLVDGQDEAAITFTLDEEVADVAPGIAVRVGSGSASCTHQQTQEGFAFTCTFQVPPDAVSEVRFITITARDAAGNVGFASAPPLQIDVTLPSLGNTITLARNDGNPRAAVSSTEIYLNRTRYDGAAGMPELTIRFSVNEPLASAELSPAYCEPDCVDAICECVYVQPASGADHTDALTVTLLDLAGNQNTLNLGTVHFDNTSPTLSNGQVDGMLYRRVPWGDGSVAEARFEIDVPTAVEPYATFLVFDDPDPGLGSIRGAVHTDGSGDVGVLTLLPADRHRVYVALRDRAGNLSGSLAQEVRRGRWTVGFRSASSAALLQGSRWATEGIDDPHGYRAPLDASQRNAVATVDGTSATQTTDIATPWRHLDRQAGPSPRFGPAMGYFPQTTINAVVTNIDETILVGGGQCTGDAVNYCGEYTLEALNDTWRWTGDAWQEFAGATGPVARHGASLVYQQQRLKMGIIGREAIGTMILFGGRRWLSDTVFNTHQWVVERSVWAFDGISWEEVSVCPDNDCDDLAPLGRLYPAMAYHAGIGKVVMTGGFGMYPASGIGGGTVIFNDCNEAPGYYCNDTDGPGFCETSDGSVGVSCRFTWLWDGSPTVSAPSQNNFYPWDGTSAPALPTGLAGATMVYDPNRQVVVLFGGIPGQAYENATFSGGSYPSYAGVVDHVWEWDGNNANPWVQRCGFDCVGSSCTCTRGPAARTMHRAVFDQARAMMVIYGGLDGLINNQSLADTWGWDGNDWQLIDDRQYGNGGPDNTREFDMAYDPTGDRLLLFGGRVDFETFYHYPAHPLFEQVDPRDRRAAILLSIDWSASHGVTEPTITGWSVIAQAFGGGLAPDASPVPGATLSIWAVDPSNTTSPAQAAWVEVNQNTASSTADLGWQVETMTGWDVLDSSNQLHVRVESLGSAQDADTGAFVSVEHLGVSVDYMYP